MTSSLLKGVRNFHTGGILHSLKILMASKKTFVVIVEGNVGSGKSEMLKYFSRFNEIQIVNEPISRWQNVENSGVNIMQKFFSDPPRWSMPFQSYIQLTMVQAHLQCRQPLCMMERSLFSARHCFVENLHRKGIMSDVEFRILDAWYQALKGMCPVNLVIYLRTDPAICLERIRKRGRMEEKNMSLEYLQTLHDIHEEWLVNPKHSHLANTEVLVIDGSQSLEKLHSIYETEKECILNRFVSF